MMNKLTTILLYDPDPPVFEVVFCTLMLLAYLCWRQL